MQKPKKNYAPGGQDVMLTPPHAIEPLLPIIPKNWKIWESACGSERIMENAFRAKGFNIIGTDLVFGQDYFSTAPPDYNIEVTNIPFSIKYKWIAKAFERGRPFAFIVPYETTFAKDFRVLFERYNRSPFEICVMSPERRINFKTPRYGWGTKVFDDDKGKHVMRGNSAQMPTVWLTWGLNVQQAYKEPLKTFYVPMRNAKYNHLNEEIAFKNNTEQLAAF